MNTFPTTTNIIDILRIDVDHILFPTDNTFKSQGHSK